MADQKQFLKGRFEEATDSFVQRFTASVSFDQQLAFYDIQGSIAHATMLQQVNVLTAVEADLIVDGLKVIQQQIEAGQFTWSTALEDVHMNIESALIDRIGEVGKKLHTGRSRNDQVATDLRLFLRSQIDLLCLDITDLQRRLLAVAKDHHATIMPGFTHLQVAQPVTFGHHMMAWFDMLQRDFERLLDCRKRVNILPLGAAALAGTSYPIDREYTAGLLGFDLPASNSLDAVSDRDFAIEFCAAASLMMLHLSRWAEEIILWTSPQFDFIELPDRFCTGSSIMPQKKNPDVPELVRGKSGRVYGHLMGLLTLMKSQPLAYNKDNQEDKEPIFDTARTLFDCIRAFSEMIPAFSVKSDNMRNAALRGYATATDLADYLVNKGLPFRDAYGIVGRLVSHCVSEEIALSEVPLKQLQAYSSLIEDDVYQHLTLEGSVNARDHFGGTAPVRVLEAIANAEKDLNARSH